MTSDITYLLVLGIAVMLGLMLSVLLAVMFSFRKKNQHRRAMEALREQQQNQLIEAAIRSEEGERHRIAETLHDEVGAILSSAKLHLLGIKQQELDERDKRLHEKGAGLLNDVIKRVRGISHNLHSNILKEFGFNEAIRHFLAQTTGASLLETETALDDRYPGASQEKDMSLYRIIQELVNNTIKYAGARSIRIDSVYIAGELTLQLTHNGSGLSQEEFETFSFKKEGLGLKNIRNRIFLLQGSIHFSKTAGQSMIVLKIPVITEPQPNTHETH